MFFFSFLTFLTLFLFIFLVIFLSMVTDSGLVLLWRHVRKPLYHLLIDSCKSNFALNRVKLDKLLTSIIEDLLNIVSRLSTDLKVLLIVFSQLLLYHFLRNLSCLHQILFVSQKHNNILLVSVMLA